MSSRIPYKILMDDPSFLIVDKSSGIPVIAERSNNPVPGLFDRLVADYGENLRLVHRIDKQTSGLVIIAKSLEVQQYFTELFMNREIDKYYLAFVEGSLQNEDWVGIDEPIFIKPNATTASVHKKGRKAVTLYRVIESFGTATLIECKLITGRTHQIRVHMEYMGYPLLVDRLYGRREEFFLSDIKKRRYRIKDGELELPLISRLTLHASRVVFKHPENKQLIDVESPMPKDLNALLNQLRKLNR
ncbi:MAG TPA: RNA pseudouridine synthase [Saprospirales bacterium]|nr:RNA pseudouridine synthase [Saprospirales bacterium]HRQ29642.1 RluA family pseudouridine synthase [Saprospiraceae bacterium]